MVVDVLGEALLFARPLLEQTLRGFRAFAVRLPPETAMSFPKIADMRAGTDDDLGREPELFADAMVGQLLKPELAEGLLPPCHAGDLIGRFVSTVERGAQGVSSFFSRLQFEANRQFHGAALTYIAPLLKERRACRSAQNSSPRLRPRASL